MKTTGTIVKLQTAISASQDVVRRITLEIQGDLKELDEMVEFPLEIEIRALPKNIVGGGLHSA